MRTSHSTTSRLISYNPTEEDEPKEGEEQTDEPIWGKQLQGEEKNARIARYINQVLTGMGKLPLERIHSMLKLFVLDPTCTYDFTPQQLHKLLDRLAEEKVLEIENGLYKLAIKA